MQTYTDHQKIFGFLGNLGIRKIKIRKYIFIENMVRVRLVRVQLTRLAGISKLFGVKIMWELKVNYVT